MKTKTGSKGSCLQCTLELPFPDAVKHVGLCGADPFAPERLLIEVDGGQPYWLLLAADPNATFKQLDSLLRKTWLECCGHMSAFRGRDGNIAMTTRLADRLAPGMIVVYEYDFGSTTELRLRRVASPTRRALSTKVAILARNVAPAWRCCACDRPAVSICPQCFVGHPSEGLVCENCSDSERCDDPDMLLPLLNSPRAGVCGYTGG